MSVDRTLMFLLNKISADRFLVEVSCWKPVFRGPVFGVGHFFWRGLDKALPLDLLFVVC